MEQQLSPNSVNPWPLSYLYDFYILLSAYGVFLCKSGNSYDIIEFLLEEYCVIWELGELCYVAKSPRGLEQHLSSFSPSIGARVKHYY